MESNGSLHNGRVAVRNRAACCVFGHTAVRRIAPLRIQCERTLRPITDRRLPNCCLNLELHSFLLPVFALQLSLSQLLQNNRRIGLYFCLIRAIRLSFLQLRKNKFIVTINRPTSSAHVVLSVSRCVG